MRTPDTTPPNVIFIEAESTQEGSLTITLQLDEPGTAYCKAYTSTGSYTFNDLTTTPIYVNYVTNWNNVYNNFDVLVTDLTMETKYYVYCVAEDDEFTEGATTIDPAPTGNNPSSPILTETTGRYTLDLTPPIITVSSIASYAETTATVTVRLDEPGTVWCKAVRDYFDPPTINQIIAASFSSTTALANTNFQVLVENLEKDTEYDMYCHARDGGTEVDVGSTPDAGNPGNDCTFDHVLSTKRDIHTLGDSTPPVIVSVSPQNQETMVTINPIIQFVFNEDIQAGSGSVQIQEGTLVQLFDITNVNTGQCVQGFAIMTITLTNFTMDFSSTCANAMIATAKTYYVSFPTGVFQDTSPQANEAAEYGASQTYFFSTITSR